MSGPPVIERLAALAALASIPRGQLEWLAANGELKRFDRGEVLYSNESPPPGCYVLLSGHISVRVVRDGIARTVNELWPGAIGGRLPVLANAEDRCRCQPGHDEHLHDRRGAAGNPAHQRVGSP